MKTLIAAHMIPALLAAIMFFTTLPFVESVVRIYGRTSPAIEWHGVEVLTPVVRPGGILELVYTITVNRQCPSDLRAFVVAPDGTVPIRLPILTGGYTRSTSVPTRVPVKIPVARTSDPGLAPLQSGPHIYRATATRYCPEGVETDNEIPDATFTLEVEP